MEPGTTIQVCDDQRKVTKDFECNRTLLLEHMCYFKQYFSQGTASMAQDVSITVHCDLFVFEWLLKYIHSSSDKPQLTIENAPSILVSAEFLKMKSLYETCIAFLSTQLLALLEMQQVDLMTLSKKSIKQISLSCSLEQLSQLSSRATTTFIKEIFQHRVTLLLETYLSSENTIQKCKWCHGLFPSARVSMLECSGNGGEFSVDFYGETTIKHEYDGNWSFEQYQEELSRNLSWQSMFWQIWGIISVGSCTRCGESFMANEFDHCYYHPGDPSSERDRFLYSCCGRGIYSLVSSGKGCRRRDHLSPLVEIAKMQQNILIPKEKPMTILEEERDYLTPLLKTKVSLVQSPPLELDTIETTQPEHDRILMQSLNSLKG